ncbi:MAG: ornithine carbamoyltransferase [Phycisphaerales bacterium JB039]
MSALVEAKPAVTTDLLSIADLSCAQIRQLFEATAAHKREPGRLAGALAGKSIVLLFEKPSLRTRITFELGIAKLGGYALYYDQSKERIGERESIRDYARNLERWVDAVVARVFTHATLEGLAEHGSMPVINALSDLEHPCQALADLFTLQERLGSLEGAKLAYVGDGNNVCHSLLLACALLGVDMVVATPKGFEPQFEIVRKALAQCKSSGATITLTNDPEAIAGASAVYTDKWVSMGQADQTTWRGERFYGFQVNEDLMAIAGKQALFMHCLPAGRGKEVTDAIIDSPASIVYDQAENRLHVQNALLAGMVGG